MLRSSRVLRTLGIAAVFALLAAPGRATTCVKTDSGCTSTTRLIQYTGSPTVPCLLGHPVVQIDSSVTCGGFFVGSARVLRCGVLAEPFSFTGHHNSTHKFGTLSNWENVLWGACSDLTYSAG